MLEIINFFFYVVNVLDRDYFLIVGGGGLVKIGVLNVLVCVICFY